MPAKSQAQRAYLNAHFGHAWVKAHHFDNSGPLPAHVGKKSRSKKAKSKPRKRKAKPKARKSRSVVAKRRRKKGK